MTASMRVTEALCPDFPDSSHPISIPVDFSSLLPPPSLLNSFLISITTPVSLTQNQDQLSSKKADGSLSQAANSRPHGVQICAAVAAHCKAPEVWAILGAYCAWAQGTVCLLPKPMPPAVPSPSGREQYYKKGNRAKAEQAKGTGNLRWEYSKSTLGNEERSQLLTNEEVSFSLPAVPHTVYKRMVDLSLWMKK